jgi:cell wall-associated NlpC family hydrolase
LNKTILVAALSIVSISTGFAAPQKKSGSKGKKTVKSSSQRSTKSSSKRSSSKKSSSAKSSKSGSSSRKSSSSSKSSSGSRTSSKSGTSSNLGRASVVGVNINVRSSASSDSKLVAKVSGGEARVLGRSGDWYKLRFAYGTEGWVRQDFLKVTAQKAASKPASTPASKTASTPKPLVAEKVAPSSSTSLLTTPAPANSAAQVGEVVAETRLVNLVNRRVTVRKGASDSNSAITTVKGGSAEVKDFWGGWVKLKFQYGTIGWVHKDAVEFPSNFAFKSDSNKAKLLKNVQRPVEKQPEVVAQVPSEKVATNSVKPNIEKVVEKPADKPIEKPTEKVTEKPSEKPIVIIYNGEAENENKAAAASGPVIATINSEGVNVRKAPSTSNSVVAKVNGGQAVIIDQNKDWYQLRFPGGTVGWVRGEFLDIPGVEKPERKSAPVAEPNPDKAASVLRSANSMRGTRYSYGAASRGATDCSGFTLQVFRANGITLPRTAAEQIQMGTPVKRSELQPGDLVFFSTNGKAVGHVGIYIGSNHFIHASSRGRQVMESSLGEAYYDNHYAGARRIIKGSMKFKFPTVGQDSSSKAKSGSENRVEVLPPDEPTGKDDPLDYPRDER